MRSSTAVDVSQAADLLAGARTVAVVPHLHPDADAIGSACALAGALRKMGAHVHVLLGQSEDFPQNLRCIPGSADIVLASTLPPCDLVVTVDCASLDRTGMLQVDIAHAEVPVLVIDHHKSNPGYGSHNLIQKAESTTTLLRDLFRAMDVELDYELAYALYAGLVTDTGSFRWGSAKMHGLAAELMSYGLDTREIALELIDKIDPSDMRLIGEVMSQVEVAHHQGFALAILTIHCAQFQALTNTAVEVLVDYARTLRGTDIGVVFKEPAPGYWSVSLRSATTDVSAIAARLGGGGHASAAGYSAAGGVGEVLDDLFAALTAP